jgi:hypothetical protein
MKKDEIIKYAFIESCEKSKNKHVDYQVYEGKDQIIADDKFDGEYDIRLDDEMYRNNSITLVARSKSDMSLIAQTTIFLTGYDIYKDVFFWQANEDRTVLTRVSLGTYKDLIGDLCITIGYTQIADDIRLSSDMLYKYKTVLDFFNFTKRLVVHPDNFAYLEPTGLYYLPEIKSYDKIIVAETNINVDDIGEVHPDSKVAYKMAEKFKMHEMDNLYQDLTLGPIFFSKM